MTEYSKYNIVYRLQKWIDSVPGQTFLNYAYSWGAAIVILGTLFKLTHLPGANIMLFIGMGTEVCVFFISAFDRPFDKTADGLELPTHPDLDEEVPAEQNASKPVNATVHTANAAFVAPQSVAPAVSEQTISWTEQQQTQTPELLDAQQRYVTELNNLSEILSKVSAQSERLARDSEEIDNLNRTITGITKVYEMQLKSASKQMSTIDDINEQSAKMASQIEQLNKIYTRMIEAMTVNMRASGAPTIE